ncbi:Prolyl 4-hydroxylase, alpha subunit [Penicillium italicum]|uniref:Prolyl 4-hydroxylase, alpha subunit n=1 Tax=Penicillium italicum TaxID=40296 RepID=A0A0A2LB38_PENIT|nr:Prolyl 4-hydroxylase, alpha subunit [Penicillium italicum]
MKLKPLDLARSLKLLAAVPLVLLLLFYRWHHKAAIPTATICPNHEYTVEIVSQSPLVIYINNFLSEKEVTWLLEAGFVTHIALLPNDADTSNEYRQSRYKRMLTYQGNSLTDKAIPDERKTSSSAYLSKSDPVVACIGQRALDFHGGTQRALGDYGNPQLVKYEPGQKNDLHYDWWMVPQNRSGRLYNRRTTILAYLDDNCTRGETYFPLINGMNDSCTECQRAGQKSRFWTGEDGLGLLFPPRRGNAVFWVNLGADGTGDERTLHAALPVAEGSKVAMNFWPPQYF